MTARPNVRRVPAGRAATRAEYANRHKPVTVWLTNEEHADVVRHVARRRVADPHTRASVSGVLRELAVAGLGTAGDVPVAVPRLEVAAEPVGQELTTQQAADLLNVSRQYVNSDREGSFAGRVELTARQRSYVLHLLAEAYVEGWTPRGIENRREFHARLAGDLIGPLRLVAAAESPASATSSTPEIRDAEGAVEPSLDPAPRRPLPRGQVGDHPQGIPHDSASKGDWERRVMANVSRLCEELRRLSELTQPATCPHLQTSRGADVPLAEDAEVTRAIANDDEEG